MNQNKGSGNTTLQTGNLAVLAFSNVTVVDRLYTRLNNNYGDLLQTIGASFQRLPVYGQPLIAHNATAAEQALSLGISASDKVVPLIYSLSGDNIAGRLGGLSIAALDVVMNFDNFTQGYDLSVQWKFINNLADGDELTDLQRLFTVTPTAGVNTFSEFAILPVVTPEYITGLGTVTVDGQTIGAITSGTKTRGSYLYPVSQSYLSNPSDPSVPAGSFLIFKNCAAVPEIKVTPIFAHSLTPALLQEMMTSNGVVIPPASNVLTF